LPAAMHSSLLRNWQISLMLPWSQGTTRRGEFQLSSGTLEKSLRFLSLISGMQAIQKAFIWRHFPSIRGLSFRYRTDAMLSAVTALYRMPGGEAGVSRSKRLLTV